MNMKRHDERVALGKKEMAVAEKIMDVINEEFPGNQPSQMTAIWLAIQAMYGPEGLAHALREYGFIRSRK